MKNQTRRTFIKISAAALTLSACGEAERNKTSDEINLSENKKIMKNETLKIQPFESSKNSAPAYWLTNILWTLLASGAQTNDVFSLMEQLCPKDSGPPPHFHDQDESIYIIDGEITFLLGEQEQKGESGSLLFIPRATVHSFRVDSETARILNWYNPAGFEKTIVELGESAPERALPPKDHQTPLDLQRAKQLFAEVGMHLVDAPDKLRGNSDSILKTR